MRSRILISTATAAGLAVLFAAGLTLSFGVRADDEDKPTPPPTPIGSWFGVARPCTPPTGAPHPTVNQQVCQIACGGTCQSPTLPFPEVTMMPALFADGTVAATDFGSVGVSPPGFPIAGDGHSTALGKWILHGRARIGSLRVDRYNASFIWFQGRFPGEPYNVASPVGFFRGSMRPRFVTFFDKRNPDVMLGFLQPYGYEYTDANGFVILKPGTPFPNPDPIGPLPATCDPTAHTKPYCFGTFQFTIRRVTAE